MRKLFLALGAMSIGVLAMTSSAFASSNLTCTGLVVGGTYNDVTVPDNASCLLVGVTVEGNAKAKTNSYLEISGGGVGNDVKGDKSTTVFVHDGVAIGNNLQANSTQQVLAFDSTVGNNIEVNKAPIGFGQVNICGMATNGNLTVQSSGSDILVGDPLTADCTGNTVGGNVTIQSNQTDVELIVRGNAVTGNMTVQNNSGSSVKAVEGNSGGETLNCKGNSAPFTGGGNTGWQQQKNQCAGP